MFVPFLTGFAGIFAPFIPRLKPWAFWRTSCKVTKGRRPKAVCTSGQLQARGMERGFQQARDFSHE